MKKSRKEEPDWLSRSEVTFKKTGKMILRGNIPIDFSLIRSRPSLKELNISRSNVTSLEGLAYQPNIETFIAENSQLSSFRNFISISNISSINCKNTPLSKANHYRLTLAIMFDNLRNIDGVLLSRGLINKARTYPPCVKYLISKGWEIVVPCPPSEELSILCNQHSISVVSDDNSLNFEDTYLDDNSALSEELEFEDIEDEHYLETIERLMEVHEKVIKDSAIQFKLLDGPSLLFENRLKAILSRKNFEFRDDENLDEQLVDAVAFAIQRSRNNGTN